MKSSVKYKMKVRVGAELRCLGFLLKYLLIGITVILTSCFFPGLNQDDVDRLTDLMPPEILLTSPQDQDKYGASVLIEGRVIDYANAAKTKSGRVSSLSCEILGEAAFYPLALEQGVFRQVISTGEYTATLNLKFTATDWNGLPTSITVTLLSGPFAAFRVVPGSNEVLLSWDPVPAADTYTLYYTDDGSIPSESNGKQEEGVQSPFLLSGLQNGLLYSFLLKAASNAPGVEDNRSHVIKTIPLSPFSLFPNVDSYFDQLELRWERIPGSEKYIVYRSESRDGIYIPVGGDIAANHFTDTNVVPGRAYYYKIAPAVKGCRQSEAAAAFLYPLKPFCYEERPVENITAGGSLTVNGSYGYVSGTCNGVSGIHCFSLQNPAHPLYIRSIALAAPVRKIVSAAQYVVAALAGTVSRIDVSDPLFPGAPELIWDGGGVPFIDMQAADSMLYLTGESTGIVRIDLSASGAPEPVTIIPTTGTIEKIVVQNEKLYYIVYTTDAGSGLTLSSELVIYNLATTTSVSCVLYDEFSGYYPGSVEAVQDETLIFSLYRWDGGRDIFDVTEAGLTDLFFSGYPFPLLFLPDIRAIDFYRGFLIIGSRHNLLLMNLESQTRIQYNRFPAFVNSLVFYNDYFYACSTDYAGIRIFNIRTPFDAALTHSLTVGEGCYAMKTAGTSACFVFPGAIQIYDIADPGNITLTGTIPVTGLAADTPTHVKISGKYLFLANNNNFSVYDITGQGTAISVYPLTGGKILDMQIHRDFVYLSSGFSGFTILDISRPADPRLFYTYTGQLPVNRSFLVDGYLYLVTRNSIFILDDSYLPTTRIISKPPLFIDKIESGLLRYPQLFLFNTDINNSGYFIGHIYSLALPQYPRILDQNNINFPTALPDNFSLVGTYAIGIAYRDLNQDNVPDIVNSLYDLNDFDNIAYIGPLEPAFTACEINGDYLYTYNRENGILNILNLPGVSESFL